MGDDVLSSQSPVPLRKLVIIFLLLIVVPIGISAGRYYWVGDHRGNRQTADRSSAGLPPAASSHPEALIGYKVRSSALISSLLLRAIDAWYAAAAARRNHHSLALWGRALRSIRLGYSAALVAMQPWQKAATSRAI